MKAQIIFALEIVVMINVTNSRNILLLNKKISKYLIKNIIFIICCLDIYVVTMNDEYIVKTVLHAGSETINFAPGTKVRLYLLFFF